jgi:hypothetical protein
MTLEAWVNPTTLSSAWRDVIYKGNDKYYPCRRPRVAAACQVEVESLAGATSAWRTYLDSKRWMGWTHPKLKAVENAPPRGTR